MRSPNFLDIFSQKIFIIKDGKIWITLHFRQFLDAIGLFLQNIWSSCSETKELKKETFGIWELLKFFLGLSKLYHFFF
jgi:hypothetical protein